MRTATVPPWIMEAKCLLVLDKGLWWREERWSTRESVHLQEDNTVTHYPVKELKEGRDGGHLFRGSSGRWF